MLCCAFEGRTLNQDMRPVARGRQSRASNVVATAIALCAWPRAELRRCCCGCPANPDACACYDRGSAHAYGFAVHIHNMVGVCKRKVRYTRDTDPTLEASGQPFGARTHTHLPLARAAIRRAQHPSSRRRACIASGREPKVLVLATRCARRPHATRVRGGTRAPVWRAALTTINARGTLNAPIATAPHTTARGSLRPLGVPCHSWAWLRQ